MIMWDKLGVTAKFLSAIVVGILVIQAGGVLTSLDQSRRSLDTQQGHFVDLLRQVEKNQVDFLFEELEGKVQSVSQVLSEIAATYIIGYDFTSLQGLANIAMQDDDIVAVNFYGQDGKPLTEETTVEGARTFEHELQFGGSPVGTMVVGLSTAHVDSVTAALSADISHEIDETAREQKQAGLRMVLINGAVGLVGVLALAALTWFLLSRIITTPLSRVVQKLSASSNHLSGTSSQVASASESLSGGTANQASALEQTTASLAELSAQTNQNAERAGLAAGETDKARDAADRGRRAMGDMSDAIGRIKASSDETSKIIKTIDEIAFQTNLLALNAAVEAARAGDAGRGFAVVAEEVRNLAQRSAEAARSTGSLIDESQTNADNGVTVAESVAAILGEIGERVQGAAELVEELSSAARDQAQGLEQINGAIGQIDHVTQVNAASADQSASASREMMTLAADLNGMVGTLQAVLGGGAKSEAAPSVSTPDKTAKKDEAKADCPVDRVLQEVATGAPARSPSPDQVIPLDDMDL
jgi:methyl-accepting chemotaxis protein